jgi:ketosteroid isomerase-like protein
VSPTSLLPGWLSDAIEALAAGDVEGYTRMYAPDAVHELPFSRDGFQRRIEGRDAITAYMSRLPGRIRFGGLEQVRVREAGDELIVEADGHHQRVDQGVPVAFDVRYVWFITVRDDGLVSRFRDYTIPLLPLAE